MNQRQNLPSEATYAQCGRQHFHPTFAVAMSAGSMISAWPKEQRHHPERKGRVTNVHPERTNHPSGRLGEMRGLFLPSGPLGLSLLWGEEGALTSPSGSGNLPVSPQTPMRLSAGLLPGLVLLPRKQVWVSPGSPCWGRGHRDGGLPPHHPACHGSPQVRAGGMWEVASWQVSARAGEQGESRPGGQAGVRTSGRCRHSDGSRKVLCKEVPEPQSQSLAQQGGECKGRGIRPAKPLTLQ